MEVSEHVSGSIKMMYEVSDLQVKDEPADSNVTERTSSISVQ